MQRKYTNRSFLDAVRERVLIFDGAMGTSLQKLDLTSKDFGGEKYFGCNDFLVISNPEAVEKVHRSFLEVGVDVLETDTFRSNRITLVEYGLHDRVVEINQKAAELAKNLADEFSTSTHQKRFEQDRLVHPENYPAWRILNYRISNLMNWSPFFRNKPKD